MSMKYLRFLLMAFVLFFFSSCFWESFWEWVFPDDKTILEQRDYEGDNLRVDGYYFKVVEENNLTDIYILYRNGVVLVLGSPKISEADNYVAKWNKNEFSKESIHIWGLYEVDGNDISLEYYMPSMYGHHTYLMKGTILNDTTFRMTEGKSSDESKYEPIDHLYRFRQTDAKPDSTNKFFN